MLHLLSRRALGTHPELLHSMFRDRKTVFVDLLKWDLPCQRDEERDAFDDGGARYLIVSDETGKVHRGSVRLLPSTGPHLLGNVFPNLCAGPVPRSPQTYEITRLCQHPSIRGDEGKVVRNSLTCALVEYALWNGITTYTGITPVDFFARLLSAGWRCEPLGLPTADGSGQIIAFQIHIDEHTVRDMEAVGVYRPSGLDLTPLFVAEAA